MPEFFSCMDIGKVNFDGWDTNSGNGIAQSNAGMRICRGVQDNNIKSTLGLLYPGHQFTLYVGLAKINVGFQFVRPFFDSGLDFCQSGSPINFRLALAKQVEIRAV